MTLLGLRSRCTIPAPWIAVSALATPMATPCSVDVPSGPDSSTTVSSRLPSMYSVTRYGCRASGSASRTSAVQKGATRRAAVTSSPNRARNSGSLASSPRITLIATRRPLEFRPR